MTSINEMLPEMDLACLEPLETMCHTFYLNKPLKSYINKTFVATILDFGFLCISYKLFARLSTQVVFVGICRDDFHRPSFYSTPCPPNPSDSLGTCWYLEKLRSSYYELLNFSKYQPVPSDAPQQNQALLAQC